MFSFTFRWLSGSQRREQLEMIIARSQSLVMQWGQHEARPVIPIVSHCVLTMFIVTKLSISHKQLKNKPTIRMIPHPVLKKKKIRFKNHLQTILNNYRNVKKTKQKCISNFKSKCVFGILHFLSLSSFSLVFHSLNPLPLTVLFLFGLVSLACLSYLATAPVQNPAGDYSGCNLNLQAKWKKFRLFVFCKLPPQTVLESLIVVCRGLMRRLHYILVYEGGGCF